jgi:hypothetical protein
LPILFVYTDLKAGPDFDAAGKDHDNFVYSGFSYKLPAHLEEALNRDPRLCELQREVQALTRKERAGSALNEAKHHLASYHKTLRHTQPYIVSPIH